MQNNTSEDTSKLFVTEIPLEAAMSDLLKVFEQFGPIRKLALVPNSGPGASGHTGHAFLEYENAENGKSCLERSRNSKSSISEKMLFADAINVKGYPVVVNLQVSREEILGRKEKKDKQNLHLLYEGRITENDKAAEGVSQDEMQKRKKVFNNMLEKLNNTNNKISTTRLAVFNLPKTSGARQVRNIFAVAPKQYARAHKKEKLSEDVLKSTIRIIDVRKIEGQQDLAFVEFSKPEHALAALRQVNNNPNYFQNENRRLIVSFAIENSSKCKKMRKKQEERKKLREQRFADKEAPPKESFDDNDDNDNDDDDFGNDDADFGGFNEDADNDPSLAPADEFN